MVVMGVRGVKTKQPLPIGITIAAAGSFVYYGYKMQTFLKEKQALASKDSKVCDDVIICYLRLKLRRLYHECKMRKGRA